MIEGFFADGEVMKKEDDVGCGLSAGFKISAL